MKGLEFPIIGTKVPGLDKKFDLNSPGGRAEYFQAKAGDEIRHIKKYLDENSFLAFILGKKTSGKGTYTKLFAEIFGEDKTTHISVGDLVRDTHATWKTFSRSQDFKELRKLYRGYISFEEGVNALLGRSTKKLLPTEFILALLKLRIGKLSPGAIFIDGLPREGDQVSYSLYFRDIINFRDDPDLFVLIDIPEAVLDERIKHRVICPLCKNSRNMKLLPTSKVCYDERKREFYLFCDAPSCKGARMLRKEGDDLGVGPIKERLAKDEEILKTAFSLHGVPKVLLRNSVPVGEAKKYFDDYEITPEYVFGWDKKTKKVIVSEKPWSVEDDNEVESFSLLASPVMVSLLKQLPEALGI